MLCLLTFLCSHPPVPLALFVKLLCGEPQFTCLCHLLWDACLVHVSMYVCTQADDNSPIDATGTLAPHRNCMSIKIAEFNFLPKFPAIQYMSKKRLYPCMVQWLMALTLCFATQVVNHPISTLV